MVIWIGWGEGGKEDMVNGEAGLSRVRRQVESNEGKTGSFLAFRKGLSQAAVIVAVNYRCEA